jgi:hypothetical protein
MTYRVNGSYLKFNTYAKLSTTKNTVNKSTNSQILEYKSHLRDEPAVQANQNVYDSLSE